MTRAYNKYINKGNKERNLGVENQRTTCDRYQRLDLPRDINEVDRWC
jgi:hypothetical protein